MPSEKTFPSLKTLFADSWQAMSKSLLNLFVLSLIGLGMWFVVLIGGLITTVGIGFLSSVPGQFKNLEAILANPKIIASLGAAGLVVLLATLIAMMVISVALVYAIANYQKKPRLGECLGQGFRLFFPLVFLNVLIFFFSFGGWFFFFIPGFLMMFFFIFARLEVILSGKKFMAAVKGSIQIASQHFGEIFGRIVLFWIASMLVSYILNKALPFLSFFYMFFISWFGSAYTVVLYRQAKELTDEAKQPSTGWIWITSLLGWVIIVFTVFGLYKLAQTPQMQEKINEAKQQLLAGGKKDEAAIIKDYIESINSEAKPYWEQSVGLFEQIKDNKDNPDEVKKLNDQNLAALKKATELDPENPELWSSLCTAQTWVSTIGSLEEGLKACQKAEELRSGILKYAYNTGDMLYRLAKHNEAVIQLEKALRINDNYGYAHYTIGQAYSRLGMAVSAREHLQKAIDIWTGVNKDGNWDSMILEAKKELENAGKAQIKPVVNTPAVPSCTKFIIREGEFASDKCYSKKDYDDLGYYLQRFNSAAFSYNGAVSSMRITCSGSDFFKDSCERDKKQKADAEANMNNYRGIINGIIARGR